MIRIDGEKIRRLREAKELTQLYIATIVGVTTDTISRWENKKYPTIKKENANKLAEALDVDISEILENPDAVHVKDWQHDEPARSPSGIPWKNLRKYWVFLAFLIAIAAGSAWLLSEQKVKTITAQRFMPVHTAPGQPFPVLIKVNSPGPDTIPYMIKEILPQGTQALYGIPSFFTLGKEQLIIRWINKKKTENASYFYVIKPRLEVEPDTILILQGRISARRGTLSTKDITGGNQIEIKNFHWADTNKDSVIDDEEILAAIDTFPQLEDLEKLFAEIEEIWIAEGYAWDEDEKRFIPNSSQNTRAMPSP